MQQFKVHLQATPQRPMPETITVTVPLIDLFARSYCFFYKMHGCTVVDAGNNLYRFTFPEGTSVERIGINHSLLTMPDKTCIDVVSTPEGQSHLSVHVDPLTINNTFMRDMRKEV